jgi:hypothetical protein
MHNGTHDSLEENNSSHDLEQEQESIPDQVEKKPLPENVSEYIQEVRDELKNYEEHKKFYETRRKKEIILDLAALLEEHRYPKDLLRSILARELGDYISTRYIEKILEDKYPNEKEVKEQSTSQIANNSRNDNKIPIEVSSTGESVIVNGIDDDPGKNNPNLYGSSDVSLDVPKELKSNPELQVGQDTGDIVRDLQTQVSNLQTKCSRFEELANEGLIWKGKYIRLQEELSNSKSYETKVLQGKTEIEFGPELLPLTVEYNPKTNQFSAWIPQEVITHVIAVLRRR